MSRQDSVRSLANDVDPISFRPVSKNVFEETASRPATGSSVPLVSARIDKPTKKKKVKGSMLGTWSVTTWIWIILVPVLIYVLLLVFAPTFVTTTQNNVVVLDHSRILLWTLILSIIVWIVLWGLQFCRDC